VAAAITGLIFGGLSLVFPDITDGFGCLLGGFCLSMWFLTLREGGLIRSTTGRSIFIGVMSAVAFSFSFSHYTRTYALMAGISFGGATAIMLGIDCLSRAGWKEFWIYLWGKLCTPLDGWKFELTRIDLNKKEFPLGTNTYPVTRAIKVEIACVIILFVCGIISQLKLWNIIKERREQSTAARLAGEENQQREEEEASKRIQENVLRERAQWEATYGDKSEDQLDSAMGSLDSRDQRKSDETIEMKDMKASRKAPSDSIQSLTGPTVTITTIKDDEEQLTADTRNLSRSAERLSTVSQTLSSGDTSARASAEVTSSLPGSVARGASTRSSLRSSVPPAPVVVPLPFTVPTEEETESQDDNDSISAVPESIPDTVPKRVLSTKRYSSGSGRHRFSLRRSLYENTESAEALVIPHIQDDTSSVAATLDLDNEIDSLPALTPSASHQMLNLNEEAEGPTSEDQRPAAEGQPERITVGDAEPGPSNQSQIKGKPNEGEGSVQVPTGATDAPSETGTSTAIRSPTRQSLTINTDQKPKSIKNGSQVGSTRESLKELLPERLSKVVLSYRTNEWAKHLENAEKPTIDELAEPESPGVQVDVGFPEQPVPVAKEIIQPEHEKKSKSERSGTNPYRNSGGLLRSASNLSRQSQTELPSAQQSQPASTTVTPFGSSSNLLATNTIGKPKGLRRSSNPYLTTPLTESPIEENFGDPRSSHSPAPPLGNTLLDKRESLLQKRTVSQLSFTPYNSSSNLNLAAANKGTGAATEEMAVTDKIRLMDQDNMTLAQRKQMIQSQSRPPSASQKYRQSSNNWAGGMQQAGFDSHQPKRPTSLDQDKREMMLATWRESIRRDLPAVQPAPSPIDEESRRIARLEQLRQKEMEKQQMVAAKEQRDAMVDNMMRSGEMLEAHREAMRRLQGRANRNAS